MLFSPVLHGVLGPLDELAPFLLAALLIAAIVLVYWRSRRFEPELEGEEEREE